MTNQPSILIVGAGPVGMSAAVELRRRGFDLRIIDQANGPAGESRALGIHARTLELFEPAGVTQKLLAAGHRVRGAVLAQVKLPPKSPNLMRTIAWALAWLAGNGTAAARSDT